MIFQIYDLLPPLVNKASTDRYGAGKAESRNLKVENRLPKLRHATENAFHFPIYIFFCAGLNFSMLDLSIVRGIRAACLFKNLHKTHSFFLPTSRKSHPVDLCIKSCSCVKNCSANVSVGPNSPRLTKNIVLTMLARCSHKFSLLPNVNKIDLSFLSAK